MLISQCISMWSFCLASGSSSCSHEYVNSIVQTIVQKYLITLRDNININNNFWKMEQLDIETIVQSISPVKITVFYPKAGYPQLALSGVCYCIWTCDPHAHSSWDYNQPKTLRNLTHVLAKTGVIITLILIKRCFRGVWSNTLFSSHCLSVEESKQMHLSHSSLTPLSSSHHSVKRDLVASIQQVFHFDCLFSLVWFALWLMVQSLQQL